MSYNRSRVTECEKAGIEFRCKASLWIIPDICTVPILKSMKPQVFLVLDTGEHSHCIDINFQTRGCDEHLPSCEVGLALFL